MQLLIGIFLLVVFSYFGLSFAGVSKCYHCRSGSNGAEDKDKEDDSFESCAKSIGEPLFCNDTYELAPDSLLEFACQQIHERNRVIMRSCVPLITPEIQCGRSTGTCICHVDLCNASSMLKSSYWIIIISLALLTFDLFVLHFN